MQGVACAADWGSIKGRFVVDGTPPTLPPLPVTASNDAFCTNLKPANKSLVVGEKAGLANVVVFLRPARNEKIDIHPDYAAAMNTPVVLDNKNCEFVPHVTLVRTGQPFSIKNSDTTGHNTKADLVANAKFNVTVAAGTEQKVALTKAEAVPMTVNCNIHTFMEGHLVVQDHPYMVVSGEDGSFEIKNIPAGAREFQFWHEQPGNLRDVKLTGGVTDRRGRAKLTIKAGETTDVGEIKVAASLLK
jgi:plastocyanin